MAPYNPYFYPNQYGQTMAQQTQQPTMSQVPMNNTLILVRSEDEARNYPVGLGTSVTFKNEREPYIYSKTMGFSQLDRPVFEKYKLVKEETAEQEIGTAEATISALRGEIEKLWDEITSLKKKKEIDDESV